MMLSLGALVSLLVYLVIVGLIFYVLWWALHKIAPPEPFMKIGEVIIILVAAVIAVNILLGFTGHPFFRLE